MSEFLKRARKGLCGNAGCTRKPKKGKSRCEFHREQIRMAALKREQRGERRTRPRPVKRGAGSNHAAETVASIMRACPDFEYVGSNGGWPDVFFIRKDGAAGVIEVKAGRDKLRAEQIRCHEALAALGVVVQVLSPSMARALYNGKPAPKVEAKKPAVREPFEFKELPERAVRMNGKAASA